MKVLVTGVKGQLGYDVVRELQKRGHEAVGVDIDEMDITDAAAVERVMTEVQPDAVIHCSAYTAVDRAEEDIEICRRVNVDGTENIAKICKKLDCKMLYLSTDYIFSGDGERPWEPDDEASPLNAYGQSKYDGELALKKYVEKYFIVRIAWVFGTHGNNFIKTMLNVGKTHDTLTVVDDQIGTPTYTFDLARLLVDMIETKEYGIYHATNEGGYISWYDFACEIFRQAAALGYDCYDENHLTVKPVTTKEYGVSKAVRPFNSRLDKSKLTAHGFVPLPDWKDALKRYLKQTNI